MKKKSFHFFITSIIACATVMFTTLFSIKDISLYSFQTLASTPTYGINMSSSLNKFHNNTGSTAYSGDTVIQTNLGNDIGFRYDKLMGLASTWHIVKSEGYFYNLSPIHGISKIFLNFKTEGSQFKLYWSNSTVFNETDCETLLSSTESSVYSCFNNEYPSFFKIVNISGANLNISNIDITLTCQNHYPTLSIFSDDENLGTVGGSSGIVFAGDNVSIRAYPNIGVTFIGWYDKQDNLISQSNPYVFSMPYEDIEYIAKFGHTTYSMTIDINDEQMGSTSGSGSYLYNQKVTLVATPHLHHSFFGWFNGEKLISKDPIYCFNMPANSLNYEAKFVKNYKLFVYSDDENKGTVEAPIEFGEGLEVTVVADNSNYALDYWADENYNEVSYLPKYSFIMPNHDVVLIAVFTDGYSLTVTSQDDLMGSVEQLGGKYKAGSVVTVYATPEKGFVFKCWTTNSVSVSDKTTYSFTMPSYDYSLTANFISGDIYYGITPSFNGGDNFYTTVYYGLYPQKNINDAELIDALNQIENPEHNGWYLYDGNYYAKTIAHPYSGSVSYPQKFNNGNSIIEGTTYWFLCSKILWEILSYQDGNYLVLSNYLLDAHRYDGINNDYYDSEIFSWLNGDFYNSAFALGNGFIKEGTANKKVSLLSKNDYKNTDYGFENNDGASSTRECRVTDWAKARGAYYVQDQNSLQYNNGVYWTSTPVQNSSDFVWLNNGSGHNNLVISNLTISNASVCIRPSIVLKT